MTVLLTELRRRTPMLLEHLDSLVRVESPSADLLATTAGADAVAQLFEEALGAPPERYGEGGRVHLRWSGGGPTRVLLVGHVDTVWPIGTLARWPFAVDGDRATGPGAFDMKAGLVQGIHALSLVSDLNGVAFVVTTDEETGSGSSRSLIEEFAAGARAALVLEPSAAGALKSARKGVSMYELVVHGRAAHAGLEPEQGINAAVEVAHQIIALEPLARAELGTTVTPTLLSGGTTSNTVPATARVAIDVRVSSPEEQARVDAAMRGLRAHHPSAHLEILGGPNRPPMPSSASTELLARAARLAADLGLAPIRDVTVGGGSDGNFTAAVGVPTLDGLGAVGGGAHAEGEHIIVSAMPERAALVAALVEDLLARP